MSGEPTLSQHHANDPDWTAHLQRLLAHQGYDPGPADGIFGPRTADAVRQYQFDRGLGADGIVGEQTWASLSGDSETSIHESAPNDDVGQEWNTDADDVGSDVLGQGPNSSPDDIVDWSLPRASCSIKRFRHMVDIEIENVGAGTWQPGQVALVLNVNRDDEGVLVQQNNQEVVGVVPGEVWPMNFPFLGFDTPGRYTAWLTVYDLVNHRELDSTHYMNTFPPD